MYDEDDYLAGGDERYDQIYPEPVKKENDSTDRKTTHMINASEIKALQKEKMFADSEANRKRIDEICEQIGQDIVNAVNDGTVENEYRYMILDGIILRRNSEQEWKTTMKTTTTLCGVADAVKVEKRLQDFGFEAHHKNDRRGNGSFIVSWKDAAEAEACPR